MTKIMKYFVRLIAKYYLAKPDLENLISIKLPNFRSVWNATLNELSFRMGLIHSWRLTSLSIEITNHCDLRCRMCPVNQSMTRPKRFMDFEFFKHIIDDNPQLEFVLVFQWGEPLLHKDLPKMVEYCSKRDIRTMITSHGHLLTEKLSEELIDAGLTRITFSVDGVGETYTKIRGKDYEELKKKALAFKNIRDRKKNPLKIDSSMVVFDETEQDIERYKEEWSKIVDRVQLIPCLTSGKRVSKCRELWRGTLVVLSDGRVTICCADYDGNLIVGDARKESLRKIWNGVAIRKLRKEHIAREFPSICASCNEYETDKVSKRFS
jgi:sulfatase maturation enzyme AslB (radical SAM superfamily)